MKEKVKVFILTLISALVLVSCQTDSEKADKLRLENKFDEAAELYQKAADKGDSYAMWRLAYAYVNGDGVDWDKTKALELLKKAAKGGCEEAKYDLAIFNLGKTNEEDIDKGKAMLDNIVKTTNNSTVLSQYAMQLFFEEDKEKAMKILNKIEDKKNPYYLESMGLVYINGTDKIEIDVEKAIEYFTKAFENGNKSCANRLQNIYAYGNGAVKKDKTKRIDWLNRGIESNVADCMCDMALLCVSEDSTYQDIHNPKRAVELLKKATRHGSGEGYFILGNWHWNGEFLPKDDKKAFENWEKGAELSNIGATDNLAYAYRYGVGCEKDEKKAIELYQESAENGSGFSARHLYYCYLSGGCGVTKDNELAKKYLLRAAELNDEYGCYELGRHYNVGSELFGKDFGQAFVYVKKAADMGVVDACSMVAYFYENGIGCDKNPQKAKEYKDKTAVNSEKEE